MKLDPLYTLRGGHGHGGGGVSGSSSSSSKSGAAVSSLCFLRPPVTAEDVSNSDGNHDGGAGPSPPPILLASCDNVGNAFVWNLSTRRFVAQFGHPMTNDASLSSSGSGRTGPGLALRRFSSSPDDHSACGRLLYQTRGAEGVVSVHDCRYQQKAPTSPSSTSTSSAVRLPSVYEVSTYSQTFCAASTCCGDPNLLVAPWGGGSGMATARIYDVRLPPTSSVVRTLHGAFGVSKSEANCGGGGYRGKDREHGMLTSLAMSAVVDGENGCGGCGGGYVVACGMESGTVFFHDLRGSTTTDTVVTKCSVSIGKEPVLALDLFPSSTTTTSSSSSSSSFPRSIVAIAGCAGDAADMSTLPPSERGPAAILKATFPTDGAASASPTARIKSRLDTCKIGEGSVGGKPGVGCCAFRSDGRLCALGGWDRRARIFETKNGRPLAILRGHGGSVTCLDWCPSSPGETGPPGDEGDGLMATGSSDGKIRIWRVYPSSPSSPRS